MPVANPQLVESQLSAACRDLGKRLRAGETSAIEHLRSDYPDLWTDPEAAVELVFTEFTLRSELDAAPDRQEYFQRFPELRERLERLFRLHDAVAPSRLDTFGTSDTRPSLAQGALARGEVPAASGYQLLEEIDRGGMGVVYKARQAGLNRIVALKMILAGEYAGPQQIARLRREAEAAARLRHPHIVQIYEIGERDGLPFLSLEYVEGASLEKLQARWHKTGQIGITPRDAAALVETLARAVHYAHEQGVVHRDLKPGNILMQNAEGRMQNESAAANSAFSLLHSAFPKITDFGLAKLLGDGSLGTRSGALLGTPCYMAPEQADGRSDAIGPHTDVFALGVILYELLTGRLPFQGATVAQTLEQVSQAEPLAPRQWQPSLPRDLETTCLKCLQKEPRRRYASAAALADDLRRFQAGEPIVARPISFLERGVKWVRRRPAVAALLAAVVVALAAVTWQWRQTVNALEEKEIERQKAEANAAGRLIALARSHWLANDVEQAKLFLSECPAEFRDRDWRQLHRLCHAELLRLDHPHLPRALLWTPDSRRVLSIAALGEQILLWNGVSGALERKIDWRAAAEQPALQYLLAEEGQELLILSRGSVLEAPKEYEKQVRLQAVPLYDAKRRLHAVHTFGDYRYEIALSPDGKRLALSLARADGRRAVQIVESGSGSVLSTFGAVRDSSTAALVFSPDGRRLARAYAGTEARIEIWDIANGNKLATKHIGKEASLQPRLIQFSGDGEWIGYTTRTPERHFLHVWDFAADIELLARSAANVSGAMLVAFHPKDRVIAWVGSRNEIHVTDIGAGVDLLTLRGHANQLSQLAFSPDGQRLASCSHDNTLRIWDVRPAP